MAGIDCHVVCHLRVWLLAPAQFPSWGHRSLGHCSASSVFRFCRCGLGGPRRHLYAQRGLSSSLSAHCQHRERGLDGRLRGGQGREGARARLPARATRTVRQLPQVYARSAMSEALIFSFYAISRQALATSWAKHRYGCKRHKGSGAPLESRWSPSWRGCRGHRKEGWEEWKAKEVRRSTAAPYGVGAVARAVGNLGNATPSWIPTCIRLQISVSVRRLGSRGVHRGNC